MDKVDTNDADQEAQGKSGSGREEGRRGGTRPTAPFCKEEEEVGDTV